MKRTTRRLGVLLLALGIIGGSAIADAASAAVRYWSSGRTFKVQPKMNLIPNTDVYYDRKSSTYDIYRHAGRWYVVDDGQWYRASTWRGPFAAVAFDDLPDALGRIPEDYRWHWAAVDADDADTHAAPVTIRAKPRMSKIDGSGVTYARRIKGFDLYRFRSTWYMVDDGQWYQSTSWRGPYVSTQASRVPREVLTVPTEYRRYWSPRS